MSKRSARLCLCLKQLNPIAAWLGEGGAALTSNHISGAAVLEYGPTEISAPIQPIWSSKCASLPTAPPTQPRITRATRAVLDRQRLGLCETRTVRWREVDSNHRYPVEKTTFRDAQFRSLCNSLSHRNRLFRARKASNSGVHLAASQRLLRLARKGWCPLRLLLRQRPHTVPGRERSRSTPTIW